MKNAKRQSYFFKVLVTLFLLTLFANTHLSAQWKIDESFESGTIPEGWTVHDANDDGTTWRTYKSVAFANSGEYAALVESSKKGDDWLITSQVKVDAGDQLIFYARSWKSTEKMEVKLSTSGTAVNDFSTLLGTVNDVGKSYTEYSYDLSAWTGQDVYLAIRWVYNDYAFLVDDIKVGQEPPVTDPWKINESFEGGTIPEGWTVHDANDDGTTWRTYKSASFANSGEYAALVESSKKGDDWLITPQVKVDAGDQLIFYARSWKSTEKMEVKLSTSGTAVNNFSTLLGAVNDVGKSYTEYSYDLSAWAGQDVYLAIRWVYNDYAFLVDDIKVGQMKAEDLDVGIAIIESPEGYHVQGTSIIPKATVKNFGTTTLAKAFSVKCEIANEGGANVFEQTVEFSESLEPNATAPVSFPAWTPSSAGIYNIKVSTLLDNDIDPSNDIATKETEIAAHYGTGGPDTQSYRWIDSDETGGPVYNWIEISKTGASAIMHGVDAFHGDDNFSEPISFGFDFPFYGIKHSYFHVDVNGELLLGENRWYIPFGEGNWGYDGNIFNYAHPIPGNDVMPNLIAVFWDDLLVEQSEGDIYYQTFGTAPNRYCVVQWHNVKFAAGTKGEPTICFQVILHENGDIVMQYKNVENGQSNSNVPHEYGKSATVAIQNGTAEAGLCYLTEIVVDNKYIGPEPKGNLLKNEMAVKFYIGEDTQPPLFSHDSIWNSFATTQKISATITDVSGIASDSMYYSFGDGWQKMTHTSFEEPNIYHYVLTDIPKGVKLSYYFVATDNSANKNRGVFKPYDTEEPFSFMILPTEGTRVLIASPGIAPGFLDYKKTELPVFMKTLDGAGVTYDIYNYNAYEEYEFPDSYDIIFAYANQPNLQPENQKFALEMMHFLDKGTETRPKNLFFASDNIGLVQHPQFNSDPQKKFFQAYLRAGYLPQGVPQGGTNGLAGPNVTEYTHGTIKALGGSPIGLKDQIIKVYADSPDVLVNDVCPDYFADEVKNPEISSWGAYVFHDGPINGDAYSKTKGCALWLDNLIYKSFFISFDISQIEEETDVNKMFSEALKWYGVSSKIYVVEASVEPEAGGTITPSGKVEVMENYDANFTIKPNLGYEIADVLVDGVSVGNAGFYKFENVKANHTIVAKFVEKQVFEITASAEPTAGGTIAPAGKVKVEKNSDAEFAISPNEGYEIEEVVVDGADVGATTVYKFKNVTANHTIVAKFIKKESITDIDGQQITVYPNPTTGLIYLKTDSKEAFTIRIFDMTGRQIREVTTGAEQAIDMSDCNAGIYFLELNGKTIKVMKD